MDIQQLKARLRMRGIRPTRQRMAVLTALSRASGALTPGQILQEARREYSDLALATVYRTVDLLERTGGLRRIHGVDGCEGVVLATAAHGHHVRCSRCGRVAEFRSCDLEGTMEAAARETGFVIDHHYLELTGVCSGCRREGQST